MIYLSFIISEIWLIHSPILSWRILKWTPTSQLVNFVISKQQTQLTVSYVTFSIYILKIITFLILSPCSPSHVVTTHVQETTL